MGKNRLSNEKSPYLLQHKDNPVHWQPWSQEAFDQASLENKPVFLSIGYSTCHWCHVMEKESFEDDEVADLLNKSFISVKVDREERPDIDNVYMTVAQVMTGQGGWPLTMIMTPEQNPFFAATYIPKNSGRGRLGLIDLLNRVSGLWNRDKKLYENVDQIQEALQPVDDDFVDLTSDIFTKAFEDFKYRYDPVYGGFGERPKFASTHNLTFLLQYSIETKNDLALQMAQTTLLNMRLGGIFDHIGFGFHRYSTDQKWVLPHFEKMLYDQASLSIVYTTAYTIFSAQSFTNTPGHVNSHVNSDTNSQPDPHVNLAVNENMNESRNEDKLDNISNFKSPIADLFHKIVDEIFTYVSDKLTSKEGAFFCAEDADSQGEEGTFYVYSLNELKDILDVKQIDFLKDNFSLLEEGNFKEESTAQLTGSNILHLQKEHQNYSLAQKINATILNEEFERTWQVIRQKLRQYRETRIHPFKDDKILADMNGLMVASYAEAGFTFGNDAYTAVAEKAAKFILQHMHTGEDGLWHRYRDFQAGIQGLLNDYIFFTYGLLKLYKATGKIIYLQKAIVFTQKSVTDFWDIRSGGFFMNQNSFDSTLNAGTILTMNSNVNFASDTSSDSISQTSDVTNGDTKPGNNNSIDIDKLIFRPKDYYDGAIASGNSIALSNLLCLYKLTANKTWKYYADLLVRSLSAQLKASPSAFSAFLSSLYRDFSRTFEIVLVIPNSKKGLKEMLAVIRKLPSFQFALLYKEEKEITFAQVADDLSAKIENNNRGDEVGDTNRDNKSNKKRQESLNSDGDTFVSIDEISVFTKDMKCVNNTTTAYVCENYICRDPIIDFKKLHQHLITKPD